MAGSPEPKIPCHCPECNGKEIEPAAWRQHNGHSQKGQFAKTKDRMWYMGHWWYKEADF